MSEIFYIVQATDLGGLRVHLVFSDGVESTVDVGDFIRRHPHPQYDRYLDPKQFAKFKIERGNIVWGKNRDLAFHLEDLHDGNIG